MKTQTLPSGDEIGIERRRYGNTTFTWVSVRLDGEWVSLGDPWPCITPKRTEVQREIERVKHEKKNNGLEKKNNGLVAD